MNALSKVKIGQVQTVAKLGTQETTVRRKLMAMGITPGSSLIVEQRFPSYIVKVGYTRAALDREIAATIFVN
ncbi:MAG: FeoA family protein [Xenococcaceae cyanobacterium MO_234.B1]|nr:FeoA family protein [Xenococcaceae cyanobacterium MO_234.B1]